MSKKVVKQPAKQAVKQHQEVSVQEALSMSEEFFSKYKSHIMYGAIALIVLVGIGFAYHKLFREPKIEEAMGQMFLAEQSFRNGQFETALDGDGNLLGFNQIVGEYGTLAGKAIHFYIGVCHLQLGDYESAIEALKKYSSKDFVVQARAYCCIGDAYANLDDLANAEGYYLKAARHHDNILAATYLMKAAIICEETGAYTRAIQFYKEIKEKYPQTSEAYEADKYIARLQAAQ